MGIRRGFLVLVLVLTAVIQHTPAFNFSIGSLSPMLLVPFTVCVAMYERSMTGLAFGVLAGALWDFASTGADGMFTLMLATIGFFTGMAVTFYVRNRLISAFALTFISSCAVSIAYWMLFVLRKGFDGTWIVLATHFIPLAVYTTAFTVVYYYLIGFIIKATGKADGSKRTYVG